MSDSEMFYVTKKDFESLLYSLGSFLVLWGIIPWICLFVWNLLKNDFNLPTCSYWQMVGIQVVVRSMTVQLSRPK